MANHLFNYRWKLSNGYPSQGIMHHNKLVFGTFICGGGSSMGYKLAGYRHLGGVEIDKKLVNIYNINHHPEYLYNCDIRAFNNRSDLPDILYNLDVLDGSPPCSSFSIEGNREKDWGKIKKFAEGQEKQSLDDLVFHYCNMIIKLKPKCFLLENVKGLILGNAKIYLKNIVNKLKESGYIIQIFLLNAASMGVPQKRERIFIIGHKKEYNLPELVMDFKEKPILFGEMTNRKNGPKPSERILDLLKHKRKTDLALKAIQLRCNRKYQDFSQNIVHDNKVPLTMLANNCYIKYSNNYHISTEDILSIGSFPQDYNFVNNSLKNIKFIVGMSVPPVMMANIAHQIYLQWLSKID